MFLYEYLIFFITNLTFITVRSQYIDIMSNLLEDEEFMANKDLKEDFLLMDDKIRALQQEKVEIKVYYECLCYGCIEFDTMILRPTVEKLASYLDVYLYPYGNAKTIDKGNGQYEFKCQHGPEECYGNMLHACAIDYLGNITNAVFFNACMMDHSKFFTQKIAGSDDEAADGCGKYMNMDTEKIKQCAKGPKGIMLHKYYGDESKKVGFKYVPYVLLNGLVYDGDGRYFTRDVCAAFNIPPPECTQ